MKEEAYYLYVGMLNPESIKVGLDESFSKVTKTHVLVYKKGKCPNGFKEISGVDYYRLPMSDRKWVQEANTAIMRLFLMEHKEEEERAGKKFLEDLERELQKEDEKLRGSGTE